MMRSLALAALLAGWVASAVAQGTPPVYGPGVASGSGSGGTPANPTATIGLSPVNGSASTVMRSDGAPPIAASLVCNPYTSGSNCGPGMFDILKASPPGVNDGVEVTRTASITSGTKALSVTVALFASTDCQTGSGCTGAANKAIGVYGAGTTGGILSTTITAFTDSTHVTLAANAGTTLTAASKTIRYGTDNTTAIQTLINSMISNGTGGAIYFPAGMYMLNGPFQSYPGGLTGKTILLLPDRQLPSSTLNIELVGQFDTPYGSYACCAAENPPVNGSIIMTTQGDTTPASMPGMIGGAASSGVFTSVNLSTRGILWRTYPNPQINAIDARYIDSFQMDHSWVDAGFSGETGGTLATNSSIAGVLTPANNNGAYTRVTNSVILGHYYGLVINEHADMDNVDVAFNAVGYLVNPAFHSMRSGRLLAQHNVISMQFATGGACTSTQDTAIDFQVLDIERAAGGTFAPSYDIDDSTNAGCGSIGWHVVLQNSGAQHTLSVNGGSNLFLHEVDRPTAPRTTTTTGTNVTLHGPRAYYECTGTCNITIDPPVAGNEFCIRNANNVSSVITLAALGSSARYEVTARTSYGTAGTGTAVAGGAVTDQICLLGKDSTHYDVMSSTGSWTMN